MNYRTGRWFCAAFLTMVLLCAPTIAAAIERTVSFKPVPGDVSVVFLGNIFGSVDGVLAGSGSQIIGEMYGVFNAALLSFGGIVIIYTLMVSTLNTAAEGQVMGQKWSSVWIPIRSTFGLALLMPQASGYCMMQMFVMWIVLQGIGAADSVWSAALSYLNRGGVLVQKQIAPGKSVDAGNGAIMTAAMGVTIGQVCMKTLNLAYISYQASAAADCELNSNPDNFIDPATDPKYIFCSTPVPDFVNSVNITSSDNLVTAAGGSIIQKMPDFGIDASDIYTTLNGICGQLTWDVYTPATSDSNLTNSEKETVTNSRTIAVHQLYTALLTVSMPIVSNAPYFNKTIDCADAAVVCQNDYYAKDSYGYPLTRNYTKDCKNRLTSGQDYTSLLACTDWGTTSQEMTIFNGKELQDSVAAYNGIMLPTLALAQLNTGGNKNEYEDKRSFIKDANTKGWLMAGAYFFQVAMLNNYVSQATGGDKSPVDTNSGLTFKAGTITGSTSDWKYSYIIDSFKSKAPSAACTAGNISDPFCHLTDDQLDKIGQLLVGTATVAFSSAIPIYSSMYESTYMDYNVATYLKNANSMLMPEQKLILDAGLTNANFQYNSDQSVTKLSKMNFSGGKWGISGSITSLVWNGILRPIWNIFLEIMLPPIMELFAMMLTPMLGMSAEIFSNALDVMRMDGVNPIIAISVMGTQFIDGVGSSWLVMALFVAPAAVFPPAFAVIMMLMPIVTGWMGIMLTVGFTAAFYVPFVPILIFSFAGIGWMIGVIEAMTAAPIIALGAVHPEGNEAFGKAEQAIMLLLNMFLRPSLMIIGYIFGIVLSYVGVWIMNAGFNLTIHDVDRLQPLQDGAGLVDDKTMSMYGFWSSVFLFYFTIVAYTSMYMAIVQQAFEMIHYLPDKILRWLSGGQVDPLGDSAVKSMLSDVKSRVDEAGSTASGAMGKVSGSLQTLIVPKQGDGGDTSSGGSGGSEAGDDSEPPTAAGA